MMRYAIAMALVLAATLLATACKDGESPAKKTPSQSTATALRPEPVAAVSDGVLLVQRQGPRPTTFGLAMDGSVEEWGTGFSYLVSPDGEHVAFLRGESQDRPLEVVIMDGQRRETFAQRGPRPGPNSMYPSVLWSPDGGRLAYTLPDEERPAANRVYTVNADGKERREVTTDAGSYSLIGWTRDGRLLLHHGTNLVLLGDKKETLPLADGIRETYGFQMSPDGRAVAVTAGTDGEAQELWVMDTDSGESRLVAEMGSVVRGPAEERYVSAAPPAAPMPDAPTAMLKGAPPVVWSPDGGRIAYHRTETNDNDVLLSELHVVNIESGVDTLVNRGGSWGETWSPDGRYLAVPREAPTLLWRADGSSKEISEGAEHALWTPNGTLVLVVAYTGVIRLVDPDTTRVTASATEAGEEVRGLDVAIDSPVWSPSGRYLALATNEDAGMRNGSLLVVDTQTATATLVLAKGSFQPLAWLRG
jgi:Tol biopolymer transport system component